MCHGSREPTPPNPTSNKNSPLSFNPPHHHHRHHHHYHHHNTSNTAPSVLKEQSEKSFRDVLTAVRALAILFVANQRRHGGLAPPAVRNYPPHSSRPCVGASVTKSSFGVKAVDPHRGGRITRTFLHFYTPAPPAQEFYQQAINEEMERGREEEEEDDEEADERRDFLHLQYVERQGGSVDSLYYPLPIPTHTPHPSSSLPARHSHEFDKWRADRMRLQRLRREQRTEELRAFEPRSLVFYPFVLSPAVKVG